MIARYVPYFSPPSHNLRMFSDCFLPLFMYMPVFVFYFIQKDTVSFLKPLAALTHSLTHLPTHSLTSSFISLLPYPLPPSSPLPSFSSLARSLTLPHSLIHLFTHSQLSRPSGCSFPSPIIYHNTDFCIFEYVTLILSVLLIIVPCTSL
jgi:hypothetical protein